MQDIFDTLGIDVPKLIAQIFIFAIVYGILAKYAFGPVTAVLEERRRRIAEGEENLKTIKANLASSQEQATAIIAQANADSARVLKEAKEVAAGLAESERQKAVADAATIVAKAQSSSELERSRIMGELKRDFGRLIVDTTSRVTGKTLNDQDKARLNQEALTHAGSN